MTRINVVPVTELTREHLIAEYREITRVPGVLRKSLNSKGLVCLEGLPEDYVLGTGHVRFFYDKILFLRHRHHDLVTEMHRRGYKTSFPSTEVFDGFPGRCYNDYSPTSHALEINRQRIKERTK